MGTCVGLAAAVERATVILIGPTLCYVSGTYCGDPTHVDNFGKDYFEDDILDALEMHRKILTNWAGANGLYSYYICATTLVTPMETSLGDHKTPCGRLTESICPPRAIGTW